MTKDLVLPTHMKEELKNLPTHSWHIWLLRPHQPTYKKPKEPFNDTYGAFMLKK
jgi:hypothetical protein